LPHSPFTITSSALSPIHHNPWQSITEPIQLSPCSINHSANFHNLQIHKATKNSQAQSNHPSQSSTMAVPPAPALTDAVDPKAERTNLSALCPALHRRTKLTNPIRRRPRSDSSSPPRHLRRSSAQPASHLPYRKNPSSTMASPH
jgi:hypothetical protein